MNTDFLDRIRALSAKQLAEQSAALEAMRARRAWIDNGDAEDLARLEAAEAALKALEGAS